jgi:branched-chain amino acid transport system substrate-binding protein
MKKTFYFLALTVVLLTFLWIVLTKGTSTELKIGVVLPLSGAQAVYGEGVKMGLDFGLHNLKNDFPAGVRNNISYIYEDSRSDVVAAVSATKKLIDIDKVSLIISGGLSQEAVAIAPVVEKAQVPFISIVSQAPELNNAGDYVFRTMSDMDRSAISLADLVNKKYHKIAVLTANYNQAPLSAKTAFIGNISSSSKIVFNEDFTKGTTDFKTQLEKIRVAKADVVFINGTVSDAIIFLKQKSDFHIPGDVVSQSSVEDQKLISEVNSAAQGIVFATYNGYPVESFTKEIQSYFGKAAERWNLEAYETVQYIVAGLKQTLRYDREGIKDGLAKVRELDTVAGKFTFDDKGNIQRSVFIKTIKGHEFIEYK